jgi:hypothetical protein
LERGNVRVRTGGNLTALVWKDRWEVYILTWTRHPQKGISVKTNALWSLTSWHRTTGPQVTSTILILWQTTIRCANVISSGPWNCFSTFRI